MSEAHNALLNELDWEPDMGSTLDRWSNQLDYLEMMQRGQRLALASKHGDGESLFSRLMSVSVVLPSEDSMRIAVYQRDTALAEGVTTGEGGVKIIDSSNPLIPPVYVPVYNFFTGPTAAHLTPTEHFDPGDAKMVVDELTTLERWAHEQGLILNEDHTGIKLPPDIAAQLAA